MTSLTWMRRFICSAFLCTSYQFQGTDYNSSIPQSVVCNNDCHCDEAGEIYNLASLQRTNGSPRFPDVKLKHKSKWHFAYNPCASFKLGNYGDCYGDVAICMWTQSSYENIGKRSTAKFVFYKGGKRHIEYTNERKFPTWKNIVRLVCDRNKTSIASAEFKMISRNDGNNRRIFRLIHNCACGNGCPMNTLIPSVTRKDVTPAPLGPTSGEKISFPVGITAAFVVVALCVPLVIWRCRRRQRDNNPNPIPPLIENAGGCSNYGVTNNFTSQAGRRKDTNLQRYSSRRKLMNCSSCSDITMPSKDGDRGYASV